LQLSKQPLAHAVYGCSKSGVAPLEAAISVTIDEDARPTVPAR
jgi:hypothetical protein